MPDHKTLMTALDRAKKEVLANCNVCDGYGFIVNGVIDGKKYASIPCPNCAPVRALDFAWKEDSCQFCEYLNFAEECTNRSSSAYMLLPNLDGYCGYFELGADFTDNPDLTTHMEGSKLWLVHVLQVLGEWGQVVKYIRESCMTDEADLIEEEQKFADILVTGDKLVPKVEAYLEREG